MASEKAERLENLINEIADERAVAMFDWQVPNLTGMVRLEVRKVLIELVIALSTSEPPADLGASFIKTT
jgi:hypothetical protein